MCLVARNAAVGPLAIRVRKLGRPRRKRVRRDRLVDQAEIGGFTPAQHAAGEHQFGRAMPAEPPLEEIMAAGIEHRADPAERAAEHRILGRDRDVAGQRKSETETKRRSAHRCDGRDRQRVKPLQHRPDPVAQNVVGVLAVGIDLAHVAAGAKTRHRHRE